MDPAPRDPERDWIDRSADLAGRIGLNPVRVRWKLQRLANRWQKARRRGQVHLVRIRYQHKTCPQCTAVHDRDAAVCTRCGAALPSRGRQLLARIGLRAPGLSSSSLLLGIAIAAVHVRLIAAGLAGLLSVDTAAAYAFGGNLPHDAIGGEWWRLATSIFLHAGLWHLGFNLLALGSIGPRIEELYGRWQLPFLFLVTGIAGSLASSYLGLDSVAVGASGAIMGLIGIAAGWGHRHRDTGRGRALRNDMLRWAAYTVILGFGIGADNRAHVGGLVAGLVIGVAVDPRWLRRPSLRPVVALTAALGLAATLATVVAVMIPISSSWEEMIAEGRIGPFGPGQDEEAIEAAALEMMVQSLRADVAACDQLTRDPAAAGLPLGGAELDHGRCRAVEELRAECAAPAASPELVRLRAPLCQAVGR